MSISEILTASWMVRCFNSSFFPNQVVLQFDGTCSHCSEIRNLEPFPMMFLFLHLQRKYFDHKHRGINNQAICAIALDYLGWGQSNYIRLDWNSTGPPLSDLIININHKGLYKCRWLEIGIFETLVWRIRFQSDKGPYTV